jgi:Ankyrin repeats (3 copies)
MIQGELKVLRQYLSEYADNKSIEEITKKIDLLLENYHNITLNQLIEIVFSTEINKLISSQKTILINFLFDLISVLRAVCIVYVNPEAYSIYYPLYQKYNHLTDKPLANYIPNNASGLEKFLHALLIFEIEYYPYLASKRLHYIAIKGLISSHDSDLYLIALGKLIQNGLTLPLDIDQLNFFDKYGWINELLQSTNIETENILYSRFGQGCLLRLMGVYSYPLALGLCFGLAHLWLRAVLLNCSKEFNQRLNGMLTQLKAVHRAMSLENLSDQDKRIIERDFSDFCRNEANKLTARAIETDTRAFFDTTRLIQSPREYRGMLEEYYTQRNNNPTKILEITNSIDLQASGGIELIYTEPRINTEEELKTYLKELKRIIETNKIETETSDIKPEKNNLNNYHTVFIITGMYPVHTIGFCYFEEQILLFNANLIMTDELVEKDLELLAERIRRMLMHGDLSEIAFHCKAYTLGSNPKQGKLRNAFDAFKEKNINEITLTSILRKTDTKIDITFTAAHAHDLDYLRKLHSQSEHSDWITSLNTKCTKIGGLTPLMLCIDNTSIFQFLLNQEGVDLTLTDDNGRNLLHWAVQTWNTEALGLLIELVLKTDITLLNQRDNDGKTPLIYAIEENKIEIVKKLLPHYQSNGPYSSLDVSRSHEMTELLQEVQSKANLLPHQSSRSSLYKRTPSDDTNGMNKPNERRYSM